ncbi:hypothetical protein EDD18DRAFT_1366215 [Armillaria luteobubalina]|uniref:Uncharacterized protein n=1 Tax=Armillaria luteobubalina TaxID=153913 RepID=A0AA39P3L2_9AGAR|nr:hypothetical protein EDD18DRAFT_1366209 [Armillaria luteobubalina]KAK0476556.1 hypothetical protein EDD18DRAFT_1383397 [Armillaria luteobubalina]KAK0476560.1 hypothetical protein EDD18DRAFT_1366215 [Armillaria luteobubalina]
MARCIEGTSLSRIGQALNARKGIFGNSVVFGKAVLLVARHVAHPLSIYMLSHFSISAFFRDDNIRRSLDYHIHGKDAYSCARVIFNIQSCPAARYHPAFVYGMNFGSTQRINFRRDGSESSGVYGGGVCMEEGYGGAGRGVYTTPCLANFLASRLSQPPFVHSNWGHSDLERDPDFLDIEFCCETTDRVPGSRGRCMSRGGELGRLRARATREVSESFRFIECSPWHLLLSEDLNLPSSTYNATSMPRGTSAATEFCFETTYRVPASEGRYIGNTREVRMKHMRSALAETGSREGCGHVLFMRTKVISPH